MVLPSGVSVASSGGGFAGDGVSALGLPQATTVTSNITSANSPQRFD
jgi:hypothetical protein